MQSIQDDIHLLRKQLQNGSIQKAYRAILGILMECRSHFRREHPSFDISGLYQGYLDMSYFAIAPVSLKQRGLKIAIVFNYEAFRFEAWLSGANRQIQRKVWELFKGSHWVDYRVMAPAKGVDSIMEYNLVEDIDLSNLDYLTVTIEEKTIRFLNDIEKFLAENPVK